jgi:hypothetical protein
MSSRSPGTSQTPMSAKDEEEVSGEIRQPIRQGTR